MDVTGFIASVPLFSGLSQGLIERLGRIVLEKHYRKGEMVFSQSDEGRGFYVVASGKVKIFKLSFQGKSQVLGIIERGEPLGEVAVFEGKSYPAYAQALEESTLLFFPRNSFVGLISEDPSLALGMLAVLSRRLRYLTGLAEDLSLREVPGRLAAYLVRLGESEGSQRVELKISKGQLAEVLGTTPESLSRALARLSALGFIDVRGNFINIEDLTALRKVADQGR